MGAFVLAMAGSDALQAINLGVSLILTVAVGYVGSKARKIENLEAEVKRNAEAMIRQEVKSVEVGLQGELKVMAAAIGQIKERLERGDGNFKDIDARDRELERRFEMRFDQVKDLIRRECAGKDDVNSLTQRIDDLQRAVGAAMAERIQGHGKAVRA